MKILNYVLIIFVFFIIKGYAQPENFNNQQTQLNRIEENIKLISSMIENILNNPADTPDLRNDLVSSILKKDAYADEISDILCKEFLQKYITQNDPEIEAKLAIIHKMLNLCFLIKGSVDMSHVKSLETNLDMFRNYMKMNYKTDPYYKPYRYRRYKYKNS